MHPIGHGPKRVVTAGTQNHRDDAMRSNSAARAVRRQAPSKRIITIQDGKRRPIYETEPVGSLAPSSTLLVERHDAHGTPWQSHITTEQILIFHLRPTVFWLSEDGRSVSRIPLAAGQVALDARGRSKFVCNYGVFQSVYVRIADSVLTEVAESSAEGSRLELVARTAISDRRLAGLLYSLEAEREAGYPTGPLFIDGMEVALAALLLKSYAVASRRSLIDSETLRKSGSAAHVLPPRLLQRVVDRMKVFDSDLSLRALAAETGYSRRHFLRMFQNATGRSPHQYLLHLRLKSAKEYIRNGKLSLIDIAAMCGFSSHAHMSKVFRKQLGVSPSEYRRNG